MGGSLHRNDWLYVSGILTLYPVLHSLEKDGYLTAYEQETAGGRKRKYYHVTDKGLKELAAQKEQWRAFAGSVEMVLGGSGA